MEHFQLEILQVQEIEASELFEIDGGNPSISPWWSVASVAIQAAVKVMTAFAKAYVDYCQDTGGEYVIHHAY